MKNHIGSTAAIILGVLYFVSAIENPNSGLIAGPIMILGALAYRSAKNRNLSITKSSTLRISLEIGVILIILIVVLSQKNLAFLIEQDPVPNFIIPLWIIIAYSIVFFKKNNTKLHNKDEIRPK